MKKKLLALLMAATLLTGIFAACGNDSSATQENSEEPDAVTNGTDLGEGGTGMSGSLSYWLELNNNVAANFTSMAETPFAEHYERVTGVTIDYQHPPTGQADDQFNLMMASREFPDLIDRDWHAKYPGGPQKAIDDGVIIALNDYIDEYAPNLKAYLEANPDIDKMVRTDEGSYYAFPFIREDDAMCVSYGPVIRQDWLDDLELDMPTNLDELEEVLRAFKQEKGAVAPFSFNYDGYKDQSYLMYGAGTTNTWQLDNDGNIVYGAITPEYKDYLERMNRWYADGLLDPDFATVDGPQMDSKMTTGQTGMTMCWVGSSLGVWNQAGQEEDENFQLEGLPYLTTDGSAPEYSYMTARFTKSFCVAISTACEDIALAMSFLDFGYSEEGYLANNFGEEGVSYSMEGGKPVYSDLIMDNPDGWNVAQAMSVYARAPYGGPFIQSLDYQDQYYQTDAQRNAPVLWAKTNMAAHLVPPITPTSEESGDLASVVNEIETYRNEMTLKFILGTEPLDNFDDYVATIENMGLSRALEIQEAALERYNNR